MNQQKNCFQRPSKWLLLLPLLLFGSTLCAWAQPSVAEVEVRVPHPPQAVIGSDGRAHLAYELHLTNFYQSTGTLCLQQVSVLGNERSELLATFTAAQLPALLAHSLPSLDSTGHGVPIEAGKRLVLFVWVTLRATGTTIQSLQHHLVFQTSQGSHQVVNGVRIPLAATLPRVLGPPLEAGVWLVHEGPGNPRSHHWGSGVVVANGHTTIPQRYAIDFFGLDATGHAVRIERSRLAASARTDWNGYGASVLAVADGVVRDVRDGEPDQIPLAPLPLPTALTERGLMGNFVVLEVAPQVYVHYAHLLPGSVRVKVGDRVRRGSVLGRVGQSGNANAPHLHFQVSTAVTFAESEGVPFVFQSFERLGTAALGDVLDPVLPISLDAVPVRSHLRQLPLDGDIIKFKYR